MEAKLCILVTVACVAMTCAEIAEFCDTHSPVHPYLSMIPAKVINKRREMDLMMGDRNSNGDIRFYPENSSERSIFEKVKDVCKNGIEFTNTKSKFCNLNYVDFGIEEFDFYLLMDYVEQDDQEILREKKTTLFVTLSFESKKTDELKIKVPILRTPLDLVGAKNDYPKNFADEYRVGIFPPVDNIQLEKMNEDKKFRVDFVWLSHLLEYGVYPREPTSVENLYFTRPLIMDEKEINLFASVIQSLQAQPIQDQLQVRWE